VSTSPFSRSSAAVVTGVAIRPHILGSDDGLDFLAICILQKEPTSQKISRIDYAVVLKITAPLND
jgi:hypothetical protein